MNKSKLLTDRDISANDIRDIAQGFTESRILLTAFELDLFTAVAEGGKLSLDMARQLGTDERATDRLMNALCALGLLEKNDGRFSNSPIACRFLVKGQPNYMSGLTHSVSLWNNWTTLTEAVGQGKSVMPKPLTERDEEWTTGFIDAMHQRASVQAPEMADLLNLEGVSRILDIGGGSGVFAMALVRAKKSIRATVFDLPQVVPLARKYIEQEGLSARIEAIGGDFKKDEFGSGYDLVLLSAIVHMNSFEQNRVLVRKCAMALNPGGQVVISDFIMDEDRTGPLFGALFALNMLVGTTSGDTYTESEVRQWMEKAGLSEITRKETSFAPTLIIGRKIEE